MEWRGGVEEWEGWWGIVIKKEKGRKYTLYCASFEG
jgi:hypothetical protein